MSNRNIIRCIVFSCIHFAPLIAMFLLMRISSDNPSRDLAREISSLMVLIVPMLIGMVAAYAVWVKRSSWIMRLVGINFGWAIALMPLFFISSRMGTGLAIAQAGSIVSPFVFLLEIGVGMALAFLVIQIFLIPWTLFSMWIMRAVDRKWFSEKLAGV